MKKYIIPGIILVAVGLLVYFGLFRKNTTANTTTTPTTKPNTGTTTTPNASETFPLKRGSKGDKVKQLQVFLNRRILPPMAKLVEDGIFGELTEKALYAVTNQKEVSEAQFNLYATQK